MLEEKHLQCIIKGEVNRISNICREEKALEHCQNEWSNCVDEN